MTGKTEKSKLDLEKGIHRGLAGRGLGGRAEGQGARRGPGRGRPGPTAVQDKPMLKIKEYRRLGRTGLQGVRHQLSAAGP